VAVDVEVAGVGESMREPGNFVTSWWMLTAWSLLGVAVGALIGTVLKRVVPAMATTWSSSGACDRHDGRGRPAADLDRTPCWQLHHTPRAGRRDDRTPGVQR